MRRLTTGHVRALNRVAVATRLVPATIDHTGHGFDSEVAVTRCPVAGERRRATDDVEAVVSRTHGDVAPEKAAVVLLMDDEPILAAPSDQVAADNVGGAAD
jgi:hypothetical protein